MEKAPIEGVFCFVNLKKGGFKVATKLKNLKVKKVDFVDEGANPDAHIKLFKSKDAVEQPTREINQKSVGVLKRLFAFIGKAAGIGEEELDTAIEEITKDKSEGFTDKLNELRSRKIADEIWDTCYALQNSLCSILNDGELDGAETASAMQESLDEFHTIVQECITQWSTGKEASIVKKKEEVTEVDLEIMKSAVERLNHSIEKAAARKEEVKQNYENLKGEEEMKIDKSKLTDAEKAFLESIEKRYGVEDRDNPSKGSTQTGAITMQQDFMEQTPIESTVNKSAAQSQTTITTQEDELDNIYKGLHPAVRMELEELKKFREVTEERELVEVAKRYVIIGKKEEELVPLLKSLKAAGGTAYKDMIAVLDQAVDAVEKSGVFSEIGKAGYGSHKGSAWAEAEGKAVELMKSKTGLTKAQALDEVLLENPELAARCEKEE